MFNSNALKTQRTCFISFATFFNQQNLMKGFLVSLGRRAFFSQILA